MPYLSSEAFTADTRPLAARLRAHICYDGFQPTRIEGLTLLAASCRLPRRPHLYEPGLVFILQGRKTGFVDDRVIHYGAGHYLVQAMPLPFECETVPDAGAPLLGAALTIPPDMLYELVSALPDGMVASDAADLADSLPLAAVPLDRRMYEALARLLACLDDPLAVPALSGARMREVVFEALRGPQGHLLRQLLSEQGVYARIGQAIARLRNEYASTLSVQSLAASVHMSSSSFHEHFKRVTRVSPLQYQKRIRLLRARDLLTRQKVNVGGAASAVGYQSASQFSREYKRYFGVAPAHDVRRHGLPQALV